MAPRGPSADHACPDQDGSRDRYPSERIGDSLPPSHRPPECDDQEQVEVLFDRQRPCRTEQAREQPFHGRPEPSRQVEAFRPDMPEKNQEDRHAAQHVEPEQPFARWKRLTSDIGLEVSQARGG